MILGVEGNESYIASDVPAILKYARNVYYIGNLEMARVRAGEVTFFNLDGDVIVEDVKGYRTEAYQLKKKLMRAVYGIEITEVKAK